jgi:hypothetical protein
MPIHVKPLLDKLGVTADLANRERGSGTENLNFRIRLTTLRAT